MKIELNMQLLPDVNYDETLEKFPVVLEITTEDPIEIATKIDLIEVNLQHQSLADIQFGSFSHGALGVVRSTMTIVPKSPHTMIVDAMEYDDDSLEPGRYQLDVKLRVYVHSCGEFETVDLKATKRIDIRSSDFEIKKL